MTLPVELRWGQRSRIPTSLQWCPMRSIAVNKRTRMIVPLILVTALPSMAAAQAMRVLPSNGGTYSFPSSLTAFDGDLYFYATNGQSGSNYRYNSESNAATMIEFPRGPWAAYDETLFYQTYNGQLPYEVRRLDGGPGWTGLPASLNHTAILDGDLYIHDGGVYRYNAAMNQPERVGGFGANSFEPLAVYRDELYFASATNPFGLHKVVGADALAIPGSPGQVRSPVTFRDHLYFNTADAIFRYDGSVIEPVFNPSAAIGNTNMAVYNNALYFSMPTPGPCGMFCGALWRLDADGNAGPAGAPAGSHFAVYDHDLYFQAEGELWKYHEDDTIRFTLRPDGIVAADADNVINARQSKTESGLYRIGRYTLGVLDHQPLDSGDLTVCFQLDGIYDADVDKLAGELAELPDVRSAERVEGSRFLPTANLCVTTHGGAAGEGGVAVEYDFGDGVMVRAISVPEISPPKIVGVEVDGLSWRVDGYRLPLGSAEQTRPLPFNRVGQIALVFNEPVDFGAEQLTLTDSAGNSFELFGPLVAPDSPAGEYKAIWQLEFPLDAGRYELRLGDSVVDADDFNFDGEWSDGVSVKSGDGEPGGDFSFAFTLLPGDVDGNGVVNILDAIQIRNLRGVPSTDPEYSARHDIDARGSVDDVDLYVALVRAYDVLPPLPAPSAAAVPEPAGIQYVLVLGIAVLVLGRHRWVKPS